MLFDVVTIEVVFHHTWLFVGPGVVVLLIAVSIPSVAV